MVLTEYDGFLGYNVTPKAKNVVFGKILLAKKNTLKIFKILNSNLFLSRTDSYWAIFIFATTIFFDF